MSEDILSAAAMESAAQELMETRGKTVGFMLRMSETESNAFKETCQREGYGQAEALRAMIRQWVKEHEADREAGDASKA